jgi:polyribonucleotide nucleotidyltransferase
MTDSNAVWTGDVRCGERPVVFETGTIARRAAGSVLVRAGRMVLLVTATRAEDAADDAGFFPLTVEYREKMAGAGRIPGGFFRREGRGGTHEIIGSRIVDRSIRPHFPKAFRCETQVLATLHSFDPAADPEVHAITGASAALMLSDIAWDGPVAGVRVVAIDGEVRVFPDRIARAAAQLDLVIAVSRRGLVMVEGIAREAAEALVLAALDAAIAAAVPLLDLQETMRAQAGREKRAFEAPAASVESAEAADAPDAEAIQRDEIRRRALDGRRLDGRGPEDIRPISGAVGYLPGAHGSSLFTRGETQALVTCTLGTASDEQLIEDTFGTRKERFLLHYNFPPYSVGEVRPLRGPGRREVGHGNLAWRALSGVLPEAEKFPYTIRVESEITSSNGSSSMATVCGATLAMMDAGVPLSHPVAGIAMGLIGEGERHVILSDILGDEDHQGDMDFKVCGTEAGVTAMQLDNKLGSLPPEVLAAALEQARRGRLHILAEMAKIGGTPRTEVPSHAPRALVLRIRPARIRDLIGPGGRHIQGIQQTHGVKIDVDEEGRVSIYGEAGARMSEALAQVRHYTGSPQVGRIYRGRVTGVKDFGCFVELFHGIEGLVPVAELDRERVQDPGRVAQVGDEMIVKVMGTTREGKLQLSRKAALGSEPDEAE